jgi:DNA-binding beta-propeller fold protein YncE
VIDTETNNLTTTLSIGKGVHAMVATHDGERVYALVDHAVSEGGTVLNRALAIINTADKSVRFIALPGTRWEELTLTRDDSRLYMTQVEGSERGFPHGAVYVFHKDTEEVEKVIEEQVGCPLGIAISSDEQLLYVSYQCFGPGGSPGHDSIGVYQLSSYQRIDAITNLPPYVGAPLALSPDGSQLWANNWGACKLPYYDHDGCPIFPGEAVYVIRTSDRSLLETIGFPLEEGAGRVSFSPGQKGDHSKAEAFVGDGIYLKAVKTSSVEKIATGSVQEEGTSGNKEAVNCSNSKSVWTCLPIANVPGVAFEQDGNTAYVPSGDGNVVYAMTRAKPSDHVDYAPVKEITVPTLVGVLNTRATLVGVLNTHDRYGTCAADLGRGADTPWGKCARVLPEDVAPVLIDRGDESIRACWPSYRWPSNKPDPKSVEPRDVYRCVAGALLSKAVGGGGTAEAVDEAMKLRALEQNDDYLHFKLNYLNIQRKYGESSREFEALKKDSRSFNDVTLRLYGPKLPEYLGDSAIVLGVFSWAGHTYTVLISKNERVLQEDTDNEGKPVSVSSLDTDADAFLDELKGTSTINPGPPPKAKALYDILIGSLGAQLEAYRTIAPQHQLTLVWVTDGEILPYVPMAALSYDGRHYLAERYSNAVLTTPSEPEPGVPGEMTGLVAATTSGNLPTLGDVTRKLFSLQDPPIIPRVSLFDPDFTEATLSAGLRQIEQDGGKNLFVHIGSDFTLGCKESDSFLLMSNQKHLPLSELVDGQEYPFKGVNLVAFSACQTALGTTAAGKPCGAEEMEGLAYSLDDRGNGARAVLATLWSIDPDYSKPLLMSFYGKLQHGMPKAEALRRAQTEESVLRHGPSAWAPFILIGDWQ